MPRRCTICDHPQHEAIDAALVAAHSSNLALAALYGVSESALRRHQKRHLHATLTMGHVRSHGFSRGRDRHPSEHDASGGGAE